MGGSLYHSWAGTATYLPAPHFGCGCRRACLPASKQGEVKGCTCPPPHRRLSPPPFLCHHSPSSRLHQREPSVPNQIGLSVVGRNIAKHFGLGLLRWPDRPTSGPCCWRNSGTSWVPLLSHSSEGQCNWRQLAVPSLPSCVEVAPVAEPSQLDSGQAVQIVQETAPHPSQVGPLRQGANPSQVPPLVWHLVRQQHTNCPTTGPDGQAICF